MPTRTKKKKNHKASFFVVMYVFAVIGMVTVSKNLHHVVVETREHIVSWASDIEWQTPLVFGGEKK